MTTWGFKGLFDRGLELPDGIAVAVSPVGRARIRYNDTAMQLEASFGGGGYVPIGAGGASTAWFDDGAVVRLQDVSDDVVIGAAVTVGTERLRVVGDGRFEGSVFTNTVSTAPAGGATLELTSDSGDVLVSTGGNNPAAFSVNDGGDDYIAVDTTNGSESVSFGNATTNPAFSFVGTGTVSTAGAVNVGGAAAAVSITERAGDPVFAAGEGQVYVKDVAGTAELFYIDDTGNVVQLTTGGTIVGGADIEIADNTANAFLVHEAAQDYIAIDTTDGSEAVVLGNATTNPDFSFVGTGTVSTAGAVNVGGAAAAVSITERAADPASAAGAGQVYVKDVGAIAELFYIDDTGNVVQITSAGSLNIPLDIEIPNNTGVAFRISEPVTGTDYLLYNTTLTAQLSTYGDPSPPAGVRVSHEFNITPTSLGFSIRDTNTTARWFTVDSTGAGEVRIGQGAAINPTFRVLMRDNAAPALRFEQGAAFYLVINTSNGTEEMVLGNTSTNPDITLDTGGQIAIGSGAGSVSLLGDTQLAAAGGSLAFFGALPVAQDGGWSVTNLTPTRSFDADTVLLEELADVVGTLITVLLDTTGYGLLGT